MNATTVKALAKQAGFDLCGITSATTLPAAQIRLASWLQAGMHGEMNYMARDPQRRADPQAVMPGSKSIIMLGLNYYHENALPPEKPNQSFGHVSRYARGVDYHTVIENRQRELISLICGEMKLSDLSGRDFFRGYVDYGPVLERSYALQADFGYIGKNSMLINRTYGSYFFLSAILTTLELEPDKPGMINHGRCGECRRCMDACPTGAIVEDGVVDARRCISYLTIERPSEIQEELASKMSDNLFGCDICQEVCPHNGRAVISAYPEFRTESGAGEWVDLKSVEDIASNEEFGKRFKDTPLLRTKRAGLQRNAVIVARNLKSTSDGERS